MNSNVTRCLLLLVVSLLAGSSADASVFPCDEAGVLAAISAAGGVHTFSCGGPTTVVTGATIAVSNDVVLDGEGLLTLDGNASHGVLQIEAGVTAELRGLHVTNGLRAGDGGGIRNGSTDAVPMGGTLTLVGCSVTGNAAQGGDGGGIANLNGSLVVVDSTISLNSASTGGGISSQSVAGHAADLTITRSTVSINGADFGAGVHIRSSSPTLIENSTFSNNVSFLSGGAVLHEGSGALDLVHVTIALNFAEFGGAISAGTGTVNRFSNSIVSDNLCGGSVASLGGNAESPGDTCFFSHPTDQVLVPTSSLGLGPLVNNGGPTLTQALAAGSVAIDAAQIGDCPLTDQRGMPRPEPGGSDCDSGAYEAVPEPSVPVQLAAGAIGLLCAGRLRRSREAVRRGRDRRNLDRRSPERSPSDLHRLRHARGD
jgi:hypothetical protein